LRPSPDHVYRFSGSSWRNRQAEGIVCILHHWCSGLRRQTSPNRDTRFIDGIVVSSSVSSDGIKKSGAPLSPMATYRLWTPRRVFSLDTTVGGHAATNRRSPMHGEFSSFHRQISFCKLPLVRDCKLASLSRLVRWLSSGMRSGSASL
jgi:hypothetical protein